MIVGGPRRDHIEQIGVNPVGPGGEDGVLPTFFATVGEEGAGVLEVVAIHATSQDPSGRNRFSGMGHDQRDVVLRDLHQLGAGYGILPNPIEARGMVYKALVASLWYRSISPERRLSNKENSNPRLYSLETSH